MSTLILFFQYDFLFMSSTAFLSNHLMSVYAFPASFETGEALSEIY